ncbi:hypothetical protein N7492_007224 [Penicillium capsulatum]|uniref:Uncharacterized protein n=1 Tax=Penicillium capsulatum TaxID=69766 RepID=A0A9W9I278_9EURO|nr:hypothetical protein N7492_007224 [Penicillium capsulatum]
MIAISALFEHPSQCLDFSLLRNTSAPEHVLNQNQQDALAWYARSISGIHSQIERGCADPYIALVSCVLFICIETSQGRMEEALELFRQGVSLILDLHMQISLGQVSASKRIFLESTIIPQFVRLGTMALAIAGVQASAVFALAETRSRPTFPSIDCARSAITVLSAEAMLFNREASDYLKGVQGDSAVSPGMFERQEDLLTRLDHWREAYISFCHSHDAEGSTPEKTESILLAYYAASYIYVAGCLTRRESIYNTYHKKFEMIVDQATLSLNALAGPKGVQPPFTFEMSIGLPLSLVALKCREPILRRKALGLLRRAPPMQGFFKCTPMALLIENLMMLEEGYTLALRGPSDLLGNGNIGDQSSAPVSTTEQQGAKVTSIPTSIPEEARICFYGVFRPSNGLPPSIKEEDFARYNCGPDQLFLEIARNRYDGPSNTWYPVHEVLPLGG